MRHSKKYLLIVIAAIGALSACATAPSNVVPEGAEAYKLSAYGSRLESQSDVNLKALAAANEYCDKMSKHAMFRQSTESGDHSWSTKQEDLTFICVDPNELGHSPAIEQRDPTVAAQQ
jgi:hypothetical protein